MLSVKSSGVTVGFKLVSFGFTNSCAVFCLSSVGVSMHYMGVLIFTNIWFSGEF